jgi:predicted transcriptional regulator
LIDIDRDHFAFRGNRSAVRALTRPFTTSTIYGNRFRVAWADNEILFLFIRHRAANPLPGASGANAGHGFSLALLPHQSGRKDNDYHAGRRNAWNPRLSGHRKGLGGQSLGELEAQILDIVWELNRPVTTTDVFRVMYDRRPLSYSTIMLTMAKLAKKGILTQERTGDRKKDAFIYTSQVGREEMAKRLMEDIADKLLHTSLVDAIPRVTTR